MLANPAANRDTGNIAIIEDSDGIVARQNEFNLDFKTLHFTPGYRYSVVDGGYDEAAASAGAPLVALDDDDSRLVPLPFAFPFFGAGYREVYVNSDGNLTFTAADNASTDRSLGRMTAGPPRISPLFDDLNPAADRRRRSRPQRARTRCRQLGRSPRMGCLGDRRPPDVPGETLPRRPHRIRLQRRRAVERRGRASRPAACRGTTALVDYRNDATATYSAAVAERFGSTLDVDIVTVAQRFYQTHEDAYDYLVIFNNMDIPALNQGVIAYESTVRSRGAGYGSAAARRRRAVRFGVAPAGRPQYGAAESISGGSRTRSCRRARQAGDTPVTTLAHETGHLFLAYASVRGPERSHRASHARLPESALELSLQLRGVAARRRAHPRSGPGRLAALPHHRHGPGILAARSVPDGLPRPLPKSRTPSS